MLLDGASSHDSGDADGAAHFETEKWNKMQK